MMIINSYRPPAGKIDQLCDHLYEILDSINCVHEYELYLCGDMNIPYNLKSSAGYKKLTTLERKYNLTQYIKTPTRCTAQSRNILDLVFMNSTCIATAGSLEVNISDHEPVFVIRKHQRYKPPTVSFSCRTFKNYENETFKIDLISNDWTNFYTQTDVNVLWNELENVV